MEQPTQTSSLWRARVGQARSAHATHLFRGWRAAAVAARCGRAVASPARSSAAGSDESDEVVLLKRTGAWPIVSSVSARYVTSGADVAISGVQKTAKTLVGMKVPEAVLLLCVCIAAVCAAHRPRVFFVPPAGADPAAVERSLRAYNDAFNAEAADDDATAASLYHAAIALFPMSHAFINLATLQLRHGETDAALETLRAGVATAAEGVCLLQLELACLLRRRAHDAPAYLAALAHIDDAARCVGSGGGGDAEDDARLHAERGIVLDALGRWTDAAAAFQRSMAIQPQDNYAAWLGIANLHVQRDEFAPAIELYRCEARAHARSVSAASLSRPCLVSSHLISSRLVFGASLVAVSYLAVSCRHRRLASIPEERADVALGSMAVYNLASAHAAAGAVRASQQCRVARQCGLDSARRTCGCRRLRRCPGGCEGAGPQVRRAATAVAAGSAADCECRV